MAQRLVRAKRKIRNAGDPLPGAARPPAPRAHRRACSQCCTCCSTRATARPRGQTGPRGPLRRGHPAGAAAGPADAGRAGGGRAARADAAARLPPRRPDRRRRVSWSPWRTRTAPLGPRRDRRGAAGPAGRAAGRPSAGPYQLQAAIAACHASAAKAAGTDWPAIARVYGQLARINPSPVVELNRAVAVGMARGPEAGLALMDALAESGALAGYHLLPGRPRRPPAPPRTAG